MWGNIFNFRGGDRSGWFHRAPDPTEGMPAPGSMPAPRRDAFLADEASEPITQIAPMPLGVTGALSRVFGVFAFCVVVASGLFLYRGYSDVPSRPAAPPHPTAPATPLTTNTAEPSPAATVPLAPTMNAAAVGARAPSSDSGQTAQGGKPRRKSKGSKVAAPAAGLYDAASASQGKAAGNVFGLTSKALSKSATAPAPRSPTRTLQ